MDIEGRLVQCILDTNFDDLPKEAIEIGKILTLTVLGTMIGGATTEGCGEIVEQVKEWGGKPEATIFIYGGQVPAHNAAFVNSVMARALDYCDGMVPGMHLGSTCVPTALAAAELTGGCSGKDFLAYLVVASEAAARINTYSTYDGFKPTGVCSIFAATAITARMLHLNPKRTLDALGIAFNRSGGSFQSNIDGATAVRVVQGFASQGGIISAQLAKRGITGPRNFLKGQYGYFHLFGKGGFNSERLLDGWGQNFHLNNLIFKRYSCCWTNTSSVDAMLDLVRERDLVPEDIDRIHIIMTPYPYTLVGHAFEIGDNPRVNAQFNVRFCVANTLVRQSLRLKHFDERSIREPSIMEIVKKVEVTADPDLEKMGHNAAVVRINTKQGSTYEKTVLSPRGTPEDPLTREEHIDRFNDCFSYAGKSLPRRSAQRILTMVKGLEELRDVRDIIPLLLS